MTVRKWYSTYPTPIHKSEYSLKITNVHKLIITTMLELGADNCVRLWLHAHRTYAKEHTENLIDGRENTSTLRELRDIWRCVQ